MYKYKIKVDLKSIRKNKDVGQTTSFVPGRKTISFEARILPDYFNSDNCIITEEEIDNKGVQKIKGFITSEELLNKCIEEKPNINISISFEHIQFVHAPIPEYSYKYKIKKVTCSYCKEKFMSNKLEADEIFGEDESYYSDTICPKCGKFDCVNITYESIEDALIRKDLKINSK